MDIILWVWLGLTVVTFLVWTGRHLQIGKVARLMPPLRSGMYAEAVDESSSAGHSPDETELAPPVSILVAAKDEESNIEACLQSLLRQDYPDYEVIAIDDRSADRTAELIDAAAAADSRVTALHIKEIKPGWFGKPNAMREGGDRARGEWLCFTDADCVFVSPRALTVALRYAMDKGADFLSVLPAHETGSFWERLIQPACSGILMIWFNPMHVNDPKRPTAYANGAFILMRRSCYDAIDGFDRVKAEINEDMRLARQAKQAGHRLAVVSNDDLYTVRMYDSVAECWSGWTRIFYGCFGTFRRLAASMALVTTFSLLPWIALAAGIGVTCLGTEFSISSTELSPDSAGLSIDGTEPSAGWLRLAWTAAAACVAQITVMLRFYAMNRSHPLYGLLYPIGAAIGLAVLVNATLRIGGRRSVTWRGTTYRDGRLVETTPSPTDHP